MNPKCCSIKKKKQPKIICGDCMEREKTEFAAKVLIDELGAMKGNLMTRWGGKFAFVFDDLGKVQDHIVRVIFEEPKGIKREFKK